MPSFDHDSVEEDRVETEIDNRERGLLILLEIFVSDRRKVAFLAWKKAAGTIAERQSAERHESELIRPFH